MKKLHAQGVLAAFAFAFVAVVPALADETTEEAEEARAPVVEEAEEAADEAVDTPAASEQAEVVEEERPARARVERLRVEVINTHPTDPRAFTQGLEFDGIDLIESTGQYRESTLRRVDPRTGNVLSLARLPARYFGEGCTVVGDRIYQLTWRENLLWVWDKHSFEVLDRIPYDGEGWGLAWDPDEERFIMTNGSDRLYFRDRETFEIIGYVDVRLRGEPVAEVNELEYVDGYVWANVWRQDVIIKIDPSTGNVVAVVDATGLLPPEERAQVDVLNGIAHNRRTGHFWITGKYWPKMFEVIFVPRD